MAPPPKAPGARVRRNSDQAAWKTLPAGSDFKRPPAAPPKWSAATKKWWKLIWDSPMAAVWLESDVPALIRLGHLIELTEKVKVSALIVGEIRQIEDRFGLSPKSRRMLQWEIAQAEEEPAEQPRSRPRHLKAVAN